MKSVEELLSRCEQMGRCLVWKGSLNHRGQPRLADLNVRRFIFTEGGTKKMMKGFHVRNTCGDPTCLHIGHMKAESRSALISKLAKNPIVKMRKSAAMTRIVRSRPGKLDMDKARDIRNSIKSTKELMAEYGICESMVRAVQTGKQWKEPNHFAGFMR